VLAFYDFERLRPKVVTSNLTGKNGFLSTIRLENIRDGIEDWSLFAALGDDAAGFITHAIRNGTDFSLDPDILETARRQAARHLMSRRV